MRGVLSIERVLPEIILGVAALIILTVGIASVPLLDPDEARYAASSRAMLERCDLVVPYFNGSERLNKPALFYWLQSASFRLLGSGEAAARLPSVLAAVLVLAAVYGFARRELGRETAVRATLILITCPLFVMLGKTGITDMTLCFFQVAALLLWYRSYVGRGNARLAWLGVSLALGFAFFVKGPVGIAVPCLVIAVFLALRRDWRAFRPKAIVSGAIVAAAVVLPWAGLLVYRLGQTRVMDLLERETIERSLYGLDHPEPPFYFAMASVVMFFPWLGFWPFALARAFPEIKRRDPAPLFLVVWFLTVIVFFSLIRGKLPSYILSASPPLALLIAREWTRSAIAPLSGTIGRVDAAAGVAAFPEQLYRGEGRAGPEEESRQYSPAPARRNSRAPLWVWGGSAAVVLLTAVLIILVALEQPIWLEGQGPILGTCAVLVLLAVVVPFLAGRPGAADRTLAGAMGVALLVVPLTNGPVLGEIRSLRTLVRDVDAANRPWTRIISYKTFRPSLVFYGRRHVVHVQSASSLRTVLEPESLVVMEERRFRELSPSWRDCFRIVASQGTMLAVSPIAPLPPPTPKTHESR